MIVSVTRNTTAKRRQRWTFSLAPVQRGDRGLTLVLEEFALEVEEKRGQWQRPKLMFYRRQKRVDAQLPLAEVPRPDETVKALVVAEMTRYMVFAAQDEGGLIAL
jgi:hypothetical protein